MKDEVAYEGLSNGMQMRDLCIEIEEEQKIFNANCFKYDNKRAQQRARISSLKLRKLLKEFKVMSPKIADKRIKTK